MASGGVIVLREGDLCATLTCFMGPAAVGKSMLAHKRRLRMRGSWTAFTLCFLLRSAPYFPANDGLVE